MPVQRYPLTVTFPDILRFWKSIQISANKEKRTAKRSDMLLTLHYKKKKENTHTQLKMRTNIYFWVIQQHSWVCEDYATFQPATLSLHLFWICSLPPSRLTVPRQWASALLQGLQSRDSRQTDRPCIQAEPIGLASVSCLAFKTPPLTPMSWEKWRTWQAQSLGSHWASFQSPWVSAGVRRQWGAPG